MAKPIPKYYKLFALIITIALITSTFGVIQTLDGKEQVKPPVLDTLSVQDKETVNQISNMTGVKIEEILKLKTPSNTWNDVLDKLKSGKGNDQSSFNGSTLLAQAGLDQDFLQKLHNAGFSDSKIIEAKSLAERVTSELNQILDARQKDLTNDPNVNLQDKQDLDAYKALADKIDPKAAIEFLLKLEKDFGSMEKVLDEYLLSLQIDIDLREYLTDKNAYEKTKSIHLAQFDVNKIITLEKIEAKVLELLQTPKSKQDDLTQALPKQPETQNDGLKEGNNDLPSSPLPDIQSPKPDNPQADLMKEVNDLRNKSLNN